MNDISPYNQKLVKQIILNCLILLSLALGLFEVCKSFLESNFPDIFGQSETNLDNSIDSDNFSVRGYLLLIQTYSSTHMHGLAAYVKEVVSFTRDLSLENSADSYLCFRPALLHSVSYFVFLYQSPFLCLCRVFDSVWSNIDEVVSISPSANAFVFGDLDVDHKDCLTYSSGTAWPGELCYNFHDLKWPGFDLTGHD